MKMNHKFMTCLSVYVSKGGLSHEVLCVSPWHAMGHTGLTWWCVDPLHHTRCLRTESTCCDWPGSWLPLLLFIHHLHITLLLLPSPLAIRVALLAQDVINLLENDFYELWFSVLSRQCHGTWEILPSYSSFFNYSMHTYHSCQKYLGILQTDCSEATMNNQFLSLLWINSFSFHYSI